MQGKLEVEDISIVKTCYYGGQNGLFSPLNGGLKGYFTLSKGKKKIEDSRMGLLHVAYWILKVLFSFSSLPSLTRCLPRSSLCFTAGTLTRLAIMRSPHLVTPSSPSYLETSLSLSSTPSFLLSLSLSLNWTHDPWCNHRWQPSDGDTCQPSRSRAKQNELLEHGFSVTQSPLLAVVGHSWEGCGSLSSSGQF